MLKVAFVVPDDRHEFKQFNRTIPKFGSAPDTLLEGFSEIPDCEIHVISCIGKRVKSPERLFPNVFFHSLHVPIAGRFRTLYVGSMLAVRCMVNLLQPDIVHGQGSERYPALASTLTRFPSVITLHGIMTKIARVQKTPFFSFLGITAWMERLGLRRANGVICLSHHAQTIAREFNPRSWVIPNPVSDPFFTVPRQPISPPEIIHPANIYIVKNQPQLIKALDPLAARFPFKLRFFGNLGFDETAREFQELIRSRPWCEFGGFLKGLQFQEALSRATILTLPSLEENCPMSILEGMAAGLPVAASNAGGIPDLVHDGVTGLLFNPNDPAAIRDAIERLLTGPDLAKKMAAAGKARAEKEFRPKAIAQRHLHVYREILGR